MTKKLYGYAVKENVIYQWSSESGACEVCKEMDGKLFESADEIPDRPHPNCKCHIEILEKESDETNKDPIESHREKLKERKRNELELAKLLGDTKSLEEEIDEYIKQINKEIKEIKSLENSIEMSKLDFKDRQKLSDLKVTIDLTKHKTNKAKQEIDALKREIEKDNGEQKEISQLQRRLQKLVDYAKEIIENKAIEIVTKEIANYWAPKVAKILNSPEAYQLYRVGSPGLNNNPEYIQKNAKLYNSINDLKNINLKQNIKARLNAETEKTDCKVLHLRSDSSIAQKIENSQEFKDFLINNPLLFKPNSFLQEGEIIFRENSDLYNSLHGALIKNAKTDAHGNLTLTVQDLWNFNKGRPSLRGRVGEKLQNEGSLENYYIIIDIKIPKEKLEFYKKI